MDALTQLDGLVPLFQKLASDTGVDDLDRPTPCAEWKVRDLFGHLIAGATTFAAVVRGEPAPSAPPVADDELAGAATAAITELDRAFRGDGALDQVVSTPFGDMPAESFARLLAFDLLMHTWDLATATEHDLVVPDDVVAAVDGFARQAITPELRGPHTFGPERPSADGATRLDALAAFSGRSW